MQTFVRNLHVSNKDSLQDVVVACNKILCWLTPHWQTTLQYEDVETIMKAAIYVNECIAMFGGQQLLQALILQEPSLECFYNEKAQFLKEKAFIQYAIALILGTNNSKQQYLPVIEEIIRQVFTKDELEEIMQGLVVTEVTDNAGSEQHHKLRFIIQQLFQLPQTQFTIGLDRLLNKLHFQLLGYIFIEAESSSYFTRCSILAAEICAHLNNLSITEHFINSMQQTASYNEEGRLFYWKCLENVCFARSLRDFCIKYLQSYTETEHLPANLQSYSLQNICYLYATALNIQSPVRLAYQRALNKNKILPFYLSLIQRNIIMFN